MTTTVPTAGAEQPGRGRLFRLDASLRVDGAISRSVADVVERSWLERHPDGEVVRRDVGREPLPPVWHAAARPFVGGPRDEAASRLCADLVDELLGCDAYLFAIPMYNFGVQQQVKHWIDLVICDPRAADVSIPLLSGRRGVLVETRGGGYGPGSPRHGWNHATPFLRRILGDVWGLDLEHIEVELTAADHEPAMAHLRERARDGIAEAHRLAWTAAAGLTGTAPVTA